MLYSVGADENMLRTTTSASIRVVLPNSTVSSARPRFRLVQKRTNNEVADLPCMYGAVTLRSLDFDLCNCVIPKKVQTERSIVSQFSVNWMRIAKWGSTAMSNVYSPDPEHLHDKAANFRYGIA